MPRPVDQEAKQRALMLVRNGISPAEAARRTGVNAATIRSALSRGGEVDRSHESQERRVRGRRLSAEERRQALAEKLHKLANGFLDAIVVPQPGTVRNLDDIKVLMVGLGITVDKLQRMSGDVVDGDIEFTLDLGATRRQMPSKDAAAG